MLRKGRVCEMLRQRKELDNVRNGAVHHSRVDPKILRAG